MFRIQLIGDGHSEFLDNITLHFTDLNDRTFETIELSTKTGILKEKSVPEKFNLNMILKYDNIEFIDGLSGMPYVLWGGQYGLNEVFKVLNYDFKVQPLSYNFSRVLEIYKVFFNKAEIYKKRVNNLSQLKFLPEKAVPEIIVEYPPHFENDQRKPFIFIEDNIYTFYLFPEENCTEQIEKFYGYLYALQFLPDDFDGEILHTMPEERKKIFPDEIGKMGVDDKNILLENLRIFSQSILFGSYSEELSALKVSENNIGKLKTELENLKKNWQKIKALPGKKQEKFSILKRLIQIKRKMHTSSTLSESTDSILGVHAVVLLELYKENNLKLLRDILGQLRSGSINKSKNLFELFQNNRVTAKIINKKIREIEIASSIDMIESEKIIVQQKKTKQEETIIEDMDKIIATKPIITDTKKNDESKPLSKTKETLKKLAIKYKIMDVKPDRVETMIRNKKHEERESRLIADFSDTLEKTIADKIPAKKSKNIEQFRKIKVIYDDFEMGRLIFDTFMRRKGKAARELLTSIKNNKNWVKESIAQLNKINRTNSIKAFQNYSNSLDILYQRVSTFLKKEDEKIMFIGRNVYSSLQSSSKKITKNILAMEIKFGKLLFLNDKFKLYSKEKLSSLKDRISTDVKLLKNNLLAVDHVNLSTKIVIYTTIKKMLNDYMVYLLDYRKIEAGLNLDLDKFSRRFSENRHYLTKSLYIIVNSRKQAMIHKLREVSKKYENFSKTVIMKYRFSRENAKQCIFQINRFLEMATPINEEKIFRQLSRSGTSLLNVEKSISGELALIKKIRTKLDKQSLYIKSIEKRVEKTEKQKPIKIVKIPVSGSENNGAIVNLRKKAIRQEVEIRNLKKNNGMINNQSKAVKRTDADSSNIVKKSYYYSDISVNGVFLNEALKRRISFNSSLKGIRIKGRIRTNGINVVRMFIYENSSTDESSDMKFNGENFEYVFYPEQPGVYKLRPGFSDNYGIEYLLNRDLILNIFSKNMLRISNKTVRRSDVLIKEIPVMKPVIENKIIEVNSVDKLYKTLRTVFKTKNMKRFNNLVLNRESMDIYNLMSDINRLFMKRGFLNLKITPMESKVINNTTRVRFLWTIETDEKEYSGISGFVLVTDEAGKLGIANFNGNRFYE
ncbi:hypothetical protein KAJ27_02405 [bacterium]|nr:hypothetical protein [bacterium]